MYKKIIFIIIVAFISFCALMDVKACKDGEFEGYNGKCVKISEVFSTLPNNTSGKCNSSVCGRTFSDGEYSFFNAHSPSMPIYGVRISLVNSKGKVVKGSTNKGIFINFWATDKMRDAVYTGIQLNNFFSNITTDAKRQNYYYNSIFNPSSDFDGNGIRYENIMTRLDDYNILKNIYDNYLNCKNPGTTACSKNKLLSKDFDSIISEEYYLKVEPIFVYLAINNQVNHYYVGTTYEIGTAIMSDIKSNKISSAYEGAIECGNTKGWGGSYTVFDNFVTTLSLPKSVAGYNKANQSLSCSKRFKTLLNDELSGWSKAIIDLSSYGSIIKHNTLRVSKRLGDGSNDLYYGFVRFYLYKKNDSGNFTLYQSKLKWYDADYVEFTDIPTGDYYVREEIIDNSDITNVHFLMRTDTVGDYSKELGSVSVQNGYASSESFSFDAKKKKYIMVYNINSHIIEKTNSLVVTKRSGVDGRDSKYNGTVTLSLYKKDGSGNYSFLKTINKDTSSETVEFTNLTSGYYKIEEKGWSANTVSVSIYQRTNKVGDYSIGLGDFATSGKSSVMSNEFYFDASRKGYIKIYNNESDGNICGCSCELEKIKNELCNDLQAGYCVNNIQETIIKLQDLYDKYYSGHYNLLFNYNLDNNRLDISKTACGFVICSDSSSGTCSSGGIDFKNTNTRSFASGTSEALISTISQQIETKTVDRKVCYSDDKYGIDSYVDSDLDVSCGVSYSYNIDAFVHDEYPASGLLWETDQSGKVGNLTLKLECSKAFKLDSVVDGSNYIKNFKLNSSEVLEKIVPSVSIKYDFLEKPVNIVANVIDEGENEISPDLTISKCDSNNNCYAYWNKSFNLSLNYNTLYLASLSGVMDSDLIDDGNYHYVGMGLPLSIDVMSVRNLEANLTFSQNYPSEKNISSVCLYDVENKLLDDGLCSVDDPNCHSNPPGWPPQGYDDENRHYKFNIEFRIIDTNNPFVGLSGDGRLTGSNWCLSSKIGNKIVSYNDEGDPSVRIVGDINQNNKIDEGDYLNRTIDDYINNIDIANLNEVDDIQFSNNCFNDFNDDNCILENYVKGNYEANCASDNNLVKKYIIDNENNSNSNDIPMYSFTLNSSDIRNIREYNREHSYKDVELKCIKGEKCISTFLTNYIKNGVINGNVVSNLVNSNNSKCYSVRYDGNMCEG